MCLAADKGDAQAVAAWLDEGGGVDARCAELDDMTMLMSAADGGLKPEWTPQIATARRC